MKFEHPWQVEEEEEQKEGEEAKPEVINVEFYIRALQFLLLVSLTWSGLLYLLPGGEEKEEDHKNWEVLGLGISEWNKTNLGELSYLCLKVVMGYQMIFYYI